MRYSAIALALRRSLSNRRAGLRFFGTAAAVLAIQSVEARPLFKNNDAHELDMLIRARYADLEDAGQPGSSASILLRATVASDWTNQFKTLLEVDHVQAFLKDEYSDGVRFNGKPTIPDVPGTEINRAFLFLDLDQLKFRIGRQQLEFDDQRFIGSVSFWQNEQTFDALHARYDFLTNSHFSQTYIANANRIYGDDADESLSPNDINFDALDGLRPLSNLGDHEHNTHLSRIELNEWDYSQIISYAYLIDNKDLPSVSSNTFGGIYKFRYKSGELKYRLELQAAVQKRTELDEAPNVPYYLFDGGVSYTSLELSLRHEILAAREGVSFVTPLDSGHDFQGWADILPDDRITNGIEDTSLRLNWRVAPWKVDARYHVLRRYEVDQTIGSEFDLDVIYKPGKDHTVFLRLADFKPDSQFDENLGEQRRLILTYTYTF